MKELAGKIVLITGGGSGIGKIMTRLMLDRKATVVIWDISQPNIDTTLAEFQSLGTLHSYKVDVSDIDQLKKFAAQVKQEVGTVDVIINNAGIIVGKYFHEHTLKDIQRTMDINANAPMYVTMQFLHDMMAQNSGHICNIASSAGLISNPKMSVYAASKWSLVAWSDSLRLEMDKLNKDVHVTTILPYYIDTGMFDGVESKIPLLKPESAAKSIIKAIEKNKKIVTLPSYIYRMTRISQGLLSQSGFDWVAENVLAIYKTMDNFTGRK